MDRTRPLLRIHMCTLTVLDDNRRRHPDFWGVKRPARASAAVHAPNQPMKLGPDPIEKSGFAMGGSACQVRPTAPELALARLEEADAPCPKRFDFKEFNGGRDKIRTCDPYDVNVVL